MRCSSVVLGRIRIPAFHCESGEQICLLVPEGWTAADDAALYGALLGTRTGLEIEGRPIRVRPAGNDATGVLEHVLGQAAPLGWYLKRRVSRSQVVALLDEQNLTGGTRLRELSWTQRFFLGLSMAAAQGDILLLEQSLEPKEFVRLARALEHLTARGACVINISRPLVNRDRKHMETDYLGGTNIELELV